MRAFLIWTIKLYQKLRPWLLPFLSCRFSPSCSEYCILALKRYSLIVGLKKTLSRLLRCQGFSAGGYAPLK